MLAKTHVPFALATFAVGASLLNEKIEVLQDPLMLVSSCILISAGSLLPDADAPNATLMKRLGIFGKIIFFFASPLTGGHRKNLHSIWFMGLVFVWGLLAVSLLGDYAIYFVAWHIFLSAFIAGNFIMPSSFKTTKKRHRISILASLVCVGVLFYQQEKNFDWFPYILALGPFLHSLGDSLTVGKVGWLSPVTKPIAILPKIVRFKTGSFIELNVVKPISYVVFVVCITIALTGMNLVEMMKTAISSF